MATSTEIREIVRKEKSDEKERRASLPEEVKKDLPSFPTFLVNKLTPLMTTDEELAALTRYIGAFTTGKNPKLDPDSTVLCFKYRAYPIGGTVPAWVEEKFKRMTWYWDVLSQLVQYELRLIGDQYKSISEAEKTGVITKEEAKRRSKAVSFDGLRATRIARENLNRLASAIRKGRGVESAVKETNANSFNVALAREVALLSDNDQKQVEQRFEQTIANRKKRTGLKYYQGYPHPSEDSQEKGQFKNRLNEATIVVPMPEDENQKCRSVTVSPSYNPPDHHGPRGGKYRSGRDIRLVTITEGKDFFALNVLFHAYPEKARMKQFTLIRQLDGKNVEWYFIPVYEIPSNVVKQEKRTYRGFDPGWRMAGKDACTVGHTWDLENGHKSYTINWETNRYARRYSKQHPDFPIEATPVGLADFQSRLGAAQRDMKAKMTEAFDGKLPAGWDKTGKTGMTKLMEEARQEKQGPLVSLLFEFDAWKKLDEERNIVFSRVSDMVTANKRRLQVHMAQEICQGITDIGLEATDIKELAEKESPENAENWELHIKKVQQKNRQWVAPAEFMSIIAWVATKMGVRVHWVNPRHTSRRCWACHHVNKKIGPNQFFTCTGCSIKLNRDENAARNMAQLAEECANGDAHPTKCSRDGKNMLYHGIEWAESPDFSKEQRDVSPTDLPF
jgi:hypothetical protein